MSFLVGVFTSTPVTGLAPGVLLAVVAVAELVFLKIHLIYFYIYIYYLLFEFCAGAIFLGSEPAAQFTRGEWSRAVALVSQEPVLFAGGPCLLKANLSCHISNGIYSGPDPCVPCAGTIEDNIAYGRYGRCSREEVKEAARAANAHDFISGAGRTVLILNGSSLPMQPANS